MVRDFKVTVFRWFYGRLLSSVYVFSFQKLKWESILEM